MLKPGEINKLKVVRKADIAYVLADSEQNEVFLHLNETNHQELLTDSLVDAFLYYDAKGRLSATLHPPLITIDRPAILKVVSVNHGLGVFLEMGISKDLLLSKDYLPFDEKLWPTLNDRIYVRLEANNRLVARPLKDHEITSIIGNLKLPCQVEGFIQSISKIGIFVYSDEGNLILVKKANYRGSYRVGQPITVSVKYLSKAGYEGTLVLAKEYIRADDAQLILDYLKQNNKQMPYTADTDAQTITEVFKLSRKAFKRALGLLYADRVIYFDNNYTYLKDDNNE